MRLRRDFGQLLRAIKAHALLHRFHREKDAKGRIVATIDAIDDGEAGAAKVKGDYEAVRDLFADIIAEAAEVKVSETVAATVEAVKAMQPADPKKDLSGNILVTEGAAVLTVAQHLQIDRSVAQRRLRSAESKGLIVNLEKQPRPYRPSYWRTLPAAAATERSDADGQNPEGQPISRRRGENDLHNCTEFQISECFQRHRLCIRLPKNGSKYDQECTSQVTENKQEIGTLCTSACGFGGDRRMCPLAIDGGLKP